MAVSSMERYKKPGDYYRNSIPAIQRQADAITPQQVYQYASPAGRAGYNANTSLARAISRVNSAYGATGGMPPASSSRMMRSYDGGDGGDFTEMPTARAFRNARRTTADGAMGMNYLTGEAVTSNVGAINPSSASSIGNYTPSTQKGLFSNGRYYPSLDQNGQIANLGSRPQDIAIRNKVNALKEKLLPGGDKIGVFVTERGGPRMAGRGGPSRFRTKVIETPEGGLALVGGEHTVTMGEDGQVQIPTNVHRDVVDEYGDHVNPYAERRIAQIGTPGNPGLYSRRRDAVRSFRENRLAEAARALNPAAFPRMGDNEGEPQGVDGFLKHYSQATFDKKGNPVEGVEPGDIVSSMRAKGFSDEDMQSQLDQLRSIPKLDREQWQNVAIAELEDELGPGFMDRMFEAASKFADKHGNKRAATTQSRLIPESFGLWGM